MRSSRMLRWLALTPIFALGMHASGCGDDGSSTSSTSSSTASGSGGSSGDGGSGGSGGSTSSSGGGASSSSSSTGGMGGAGGMGGGSGGSGGSPVICAPNSAAPCYTGPAATEGVGLCVGGTWTCNAEGTAFGPCLGEILPAAENCSTPADENCNASGPDCGVSVWSKRFGDFDGQYGKSVAVDAMGNIYVAGIFYGKLDVGGGPMTATSLDGFLTKLDPSGNHLWTKQFGGAGTQKALAVAVDAAGAVVVTGYFQGTLDFGGGPLVASGVDVFVAKYDASGNHVWSKRFGDANDQSGELIAIDASNNVVVGGSFLGSIDFGGGAMTTADADLFAVKLDASGNHVWSKHLDQQNGSQPQLMGVATDSTGNVALTGYFFGTMDLGGGALASAGNDDVFVAKLGPNGQHLWSKRFGGALGQNPNGLGFDGAGNLFLAGSFKGSIDLGGGTFTSAGNDDFWLAKLDPAGAHIWSKRFGDGQQQFISGLAVSKTGDLALAVTLGGSVDFGGGPLTSAGNLDIAIARLDASGNHVWSRRAGDAVSQGSGAIAFGEAGHVLITGELVSSADFGSGLLTSAGSSDLFIAKLAP